MEAAAAHDRLDLLPAFSGRRKGIPNGLLPDMPRNTSRPFRKPWENSIL
jgi:hypothetical protein